MTDNGIGRCLPATAGLLVAVLLSGCGGGGGDSGGGTGGGGTGGGGSGGGGGNGAPTADAGPDQNVLAADFVRLAGTASDPDAGDTLSYRWTQTAGPTVALTGASSATPSFTAPTGAAGGGGASVSLSGKLRYEFVPPRPSCRGLNFGLIEERPIRRATVQVLDQSNPVVLTFQLTVSDGAGANSVDTVNVGIGGLVASGTSDDDGEYQLMVPANTNVSVRVRAELMKPGPAGWNVEVRDNTQLTSLDLDERPLYVLDGSVFDTGGGVDNRDLTAATGWDGVAYTQPRAAAPFAILDSIYSAMNLVHSVDPDADFAPLDVFWSINNTTAQGSGTDSDNFDSGEIGTSFYRSDSSGFDALFLLGKADDDTEEFDDHVIVHEWGHYFEDNFSRSDSIGGAHGFGDQLDMRVAFGEGWATALSGIVLQDASYCDTQGLGQANGFRIDIENDAPSPRGWHNEFSVMSLIYDLWDTGLEPLKGDTGDIGFAPIYDTMVNRQRVTAAHTSIFSFTEALLNEMPSSAALLNDLRSYHDINGSGIYGDGETNDGGSNEPMDALPVYTVIEPNGTTISGICSNREHDDSSATGNKLSEYRFLRMAVSVPSRYRFDIVTDAATVDMLPPDDPASETDQSDPDLFFYRNGQIQNAIVAGEPQGFSGEANRETFTTPNVLSPGNYVMDLVEFRHTDEETDQDEFPARSCFDITVQPAP